MADHPATVLALFITLSSASFSSVTPASAIPEEFERITAQEAAQRVTHCGLGPVTARFDPELQEDVLSAREAGSATDEQLACADEAASFYNLEPPLALERRYKVIRETRAI